MPFNHLILCRPLLLPSIFPSIRVFSNVSVLHIRWPKYWNSDSLQPHELQHTWLPSPSLSTSLFRLVSFESNMPPSHLILCRPLLLLPSIFPSIRGFPNESVLCIRWPKYWSFSFSISPSNEYSELIFFKIDWFDLAVQGTLRSLLQHNSLALSPLYCPTLTSVHDCWKNHSSDYEYLCRQSDVSAF